MRPRIDSHMHLHPSAVEGRSAVADFPIVEYGERPGVSRGARAGTVEDGLAALAVAGIDRAWALGSFELPGMPFPPRRNWPPLRLVLAHLGGAAWRDVAALASAYPQVRFDLSEIIAWVGAPLAPTPSQLTALICEIGHERVLLGANAAALS